MLMCAKCGKWQKAVKDMSLVHMCPRRGFVVSCRIKNHYWSYLAGNTAQSLFSQTEPHVTSAVSAS